MAAPRWNLSPDRFFDPDPTQRRVDCSVLAVTPDGFVTPVMLDDRTAP